MPRERDGGTIQRRGGLFGGRSGRNAPAAGLPSKESPPPAPPPDQPPSDVPVARPRRRSSHVALIFAGAAAVGVAGGWAVDRWTRPPCDPVIDPACVQSRSSSGGSGGSSRIGSSSRSSGSWFTWGDSSGSSSSATSPSKAAQGTTERGGFGAIGRFFSSGS